MQGLDARLAAAGRSAKAGPALLMPPRVLPGGLVTRLEGPILAVPTCAGDPLARGLRHGPAHILAQFDPQDYVLRRPRLGDGTVDTVTAAVAAAAAQVVARGEVPFVLGGDHTVARGGVAGVRQGLQRRRPAGTRAPRRGGEGGGERGGGPPLYLLWLDAHPDVNTAESSPTGHLHGMVLAGLLGEGPLAIPEPLPPERVTLAGVRRCDPGEVTFLAKRQAIRRWPVAALTGDGWVPLLEALLAEVRRAGGRLYVSLDLDVFDPTVAPGVAVPVPAGAMAEPVLALLGRIRASGLLAGADLVECYPPADRERQKIGRAHV
jgi:arginase